MTDDFNTQHDQRMSQLKAEHEQRLADIQAETQEWLQKVSSGELSAEEIGDMNELADQQNRAAAPQPATPPAPEPQQAAPQRPLTSLDRWSAAHQRPTNQGIFDQGDLKQHADQRRAIVPPTDDGILA